MKTASTTLDIIDAANSRKPRSQMTEIEKEDTNINPSPDRHIGDSWFGSVDLVEHTDGIFNVKTNSSRFPKLFLTEKMKGWPSGSHMVLEAKLNEGTEKEETIYALGYKYCKSKGLYFIFTKGSAHTENDPEYDYIASWRDENYNEHTRRVLRPHAAFVYFNISNCIDVLNQSRQFDLKLEKQWVCRSGFFRIVTTLFGVTVVDCWKCYLWRLGHNHHWKKLPLLDFVNMLAKDMLENNLSQVRNIADSGTYSIRPPPPAQPDEPEDDYIEFLNARGGNFDSQLSDLTVVPSPAPAQPNYCTPIAPKLPVLVKCDLKEKGDYRPVQYENEGDTSERTMRRRCKQCKKKKTSMVCNQCLKVRNYEWCCSNECLAKHIMSSH